MYKIVFTDDFLDMLEEILESYSAYTQYCNAIRLEVWQAIKLLQTYPHIAAMLTKNKSMRKFIIKKRFSIIYRIQDNGVWLLYFIDNRMQNGNYLSEEIEVYQV